MFLERDEGRIVQFGSVEELEGVVQEEDCQRRVVVIARLVVAITVKE